MRPLRSSRPTISPTRPRSTASGLQRTRVRVLMGRVKLADRPRTRFSPRAPAPGRAHHVERARDDDLAVGRRASIATSTASRDVVDHVDDARGRRRARTAASATTSGVVPARAVGAAAHERARRRARRAPRASRAAPSRAATRRRACAASRRTPRRARRAARARRRRSSRRRAGRAAGARRPRADPACCTFANASATSSAIERASEERLRRGRARPRRCRPGARRAARGTRRRTTRSGVYRSSDAPAEREPVVAHAEVDVAHARPTPGRGRGRTGTSAGSVSPSTSADARLHDPGLLGRDVGRGSGPMYSTWSMLTLVTTATVAVDHVGGVPGAAQPDLHHRDVDRDVGEPARARRR